MKEVQLKVSVSEQAWKHLQDAVATGFHGNSVCDAAQRLIYEGLRRIEADKGRGKVLAALAKALEVAA